MADSPDDYERLIRPIEDRMIRTVWRIVRDPDDADDAFQDALATIWKRLDRVRRHVNPHAFILRICIDAAYDVLRRTIRHRQREELSEIADGLASPARSPEDEAAGREQEAEIMRAIGQLSRQQAVAILMRIVQDQSYSDIAQALGCGEATARTHVARGRQRLCSMLGHLSPWPAKEARS